MLDFDLIPAALSVIGAILVGRYDRLSGFGWLLWLLSNILWIIWAATGSTDGKAVLGVLLQNAVFFITSLQGYINWRRKFATRQP